MLTRASRAGALPHMSDVVVTHLSAQELFPRLGARVHVNYPTHHGDTPLHDHDFLEIAVVTHGRAVHRTVHGVQPIRAGQVFIIHPGQWHAYERCRDLQVMNGCVSVDVLMNELGWTLRDPQLARIMPALSAARGAPAPAKSGQGVIGVVLDADSQRRCTHELTAIRALLEHDDPVQARPEIIARVVLTLTTVASQATGDAQRTHDADVDTPVQRLMHALDDDMARAWSLDDMAAVMKRNRFHVVRLCNRHHGCSPMAWLARRRAEKAAILLLTTDASMASIGEQVGWPDANYFSRRFRAAFGMSPREYRGQLPMPAVVKKSEDWVQW